jgi:hypothetical protein
MRTFAEWKFASTTEVEHVTNIEVAITVVCLNSHTRDIHHAIRANGRLIKKVTYIASAALTSICREEVQAS